MIKKIEIRFVLITMEWGSFSVNWVRIESTLDIWSNKKRLVLFKKPLSVVNVFRFKHLQPLKPTDLH